MNAERSSAGSTTVGVLALQGSFPLHERALRRLGVTTRLVRKTAHLEGLAGLVLPGGESTTMVNLAESYGLFDPLRELAASGLPMFGTCAGAILLGHGDGPPRRFEVAPVHLNRNAYGSQIESFNASLNIAGFESPVHGIFIRAPKIVVEPEAASRVEVLSEHESEPVLVRAGHLLLATFHPELTDDLRLHQYFLELCAISRT